MTVLPKAPVDSDITLDALIHDPYPIYRRLRAEAPVCTVKAVGRTLLTRAADTRWVKDNPELFSSDDPNTPMKRAFNAHTLMRKDGEAHMRERMAMAPALTPKVIQGCWIPAYTAAADHFLDALPTNEPVDLFATLAAPLAARGLAHLLGIPEASDADMCRWSQTLIDGAGNFGWREALFADCDKANAEMNAEMARMIARYRVDPNESALSVMVNADDPIPMSQVYSNIKIAIGGGINEPRDALCTIIYGLLSNPEQLEEVKAKAAWSQAFEEGIRWIAPIQVSSRNATEDVEIRGHLIEKGETVMTVQASANRDEELFEDGERYNVFRKRVPHQAFGSGPHHCLGTHVARKVVGQIVLPMLFERFPNMQLHEPENIVWYGFGFRGPLSMPVVLN